MINDNSAYAALDNSRLNVQVEWLFGTTQFTSLVFGWQLSL